MPAAESSLLCVTGSALGAAVAALFAQVEANAGAPKAKAKVKKNKEKEEVDIEKRAFELTQGSEPSAWQGFSMAEARELNAKIKSKFMELTPIEVLKNLQRGNARFWTGNSTRPEAQAFQRRALIMQQFPTAAILGCSDSRVPVELVFDQPLGELFVVRVAGNVLATETKASLQYAINHLKVKVLLVLGHEGCGAVKAAEAPMETINDHPEELAAALKEIKKGLDATRLASAHDPRARDREAVVSNIKHQVKQLFQDDAIMAKIKSGELIVVGCLYEISSGIVDFFNYLPEGIAMDDKVAPNLTRERALTLHLGETRRFSK